jgi:hypothetical protein
VSLFELACRARPKTKKEQNSNTTTSHLHKHALKMNFGVISFIYLPIHIHLFAPFFLSPFIDKGNDKVPSLRLLGIGKDKLLCFGTCVCMCVCILT